MSKDTQAIKNIKLPSDTRKELDVSNVDNISLKLNKCVNFIHGKHKGEDIEKPELKKAIYKVDDRTLEGIIKGLNDRQNITVEGLRRQGYNIKTIKLKPEWRMIVGLGNESVYETSMTLHHIYGIPYIPGSAIKGVVRNYCINSIYNKVGLMDMQQINIIEKILENFEIEKDRNLDYKDFQDTFTAFNGKKSIKPKEDLFNYFNDNDVEIINFQNIFGTLRKIGKIIFFDAYPIEPPKIEIDIMNVHYPNYYGGNDLPTDCQNPIPVYFLTVKETPFEFTIGIKARNNNISQDGEAGGKYPLELAYENMNKALCEHGIGAKTAVGYGYLSEVSVKRKTISNKSEVPVSQKKNERDTLIDRLNNMVNDAQRKDFQISTVIEYYKKNPLDSRYSKLLFNILFDYKKIYVLRKQNNYNGIPNDLFEFYKYIEEHKDKLKIEINLLKEKMSKIIKKLGSKKLKNKWKVIY